MFEPWDKNMKMNDPEVDWNPELPDMLTMHTDREEDTRRYESERDHNKGLLETIKDLESIRGGNKLDDKVCEERAPEILV